MREGAERALVRAFVPLVALGVSSLVARSWSWGPSRFEGVYLVVVPHAWKHVQDARNGGRVATLLLNAMSDASRERLARDLGEVSADLEMVENPLVESLDAEGIRARLNRVLDDVVPEATAAQALVAGEWSSFGKDLTVRGSVTCPAHATCYRLDRTGSDRGAEGRARFLGWAIADAIVLRTPNADDAAALMDALRGGMPTFDRVALILESRELHALRTGPSLALLAAGVQRLSRQLDDDSPLKALVRSIGDPTPPGDPLPWLQLPEHSVLVVPRLGTLASLPRFRADIQERVGSLSDRVAWLPPAVP